MGIQKKKTLINLLLFVLAFTFLSAKEEELRPYRLVNADDLQMVKYFEDYVTKLKGNVIFFYGKTQFKCDEAEIFEGQKAAIMRGNVRIKEDSLTFYASQAEYYKSNDYLKATGRVKVREDHIDKTYREIEANTIEFYRQRGDIYANNNVIVFDKRDDIHGKCGYATYNNKSGYGFLSRSPVLWKETEDDSLTIIAEKIEYFNNLQKVIASFNVITKTKDIHTNSDFLIYYAQEDKAVYFGKPRFYSSFGDASAENITILMKDKKPNQAILQDSCLVVYALEKEKSKDNWIRSKVMNVFWQEEQISKFEAQEDVRSYFEQEKKKNQEPMNNFSTAKKLTVLFNKDQKIENIQLVSGSKGKYHFKRKKEEKG